MILRCETFVLSLILTWKLTINETIKSSKLIVMSGKCIKDVGYILWQKVDTYIYILNQLAKLIHPNPNIYRS